MALEIRTTSIRFLKVKKLSIVFRVRIATKSIPESSVRAICQNYFFCFLIKYFKLGFSQENRSISVMITARILCKEMV